MEKQRPVDKTPAKKKDDLIVITGAGEVCNLAADMGGMGFIERFRMDCLRSVLINTRMVEAACRAGAQRYFFSSSDCACNTDLRATYKWIEQQYQPREKGHRVVE